MSRSSMVEFNQIAAVFMARHIMLAIKKRLVRINEKAFKAGHWFIIMLLSYSTV